MENIVQWLAGFAAFSAGLWASLQFFRALFGPQLRQRQLNRAVTLTARRAVVFREQTKADPDDEQWKDLVVTALREVDFPIAELTRDVFEAVHLMAENRYREYLRRTLSPDDEAGARLPRMMSAENEPGIVQGVEERRQ